jgi:hypothetical protein
MKIFIVCSKYFYDRIEPIKKRLEEKGHKIILPNSYEDPFIEERIKKLSHEEHLAFKKAMFKQSDDKIRESEALFVLNDEKNGQKNYVGGATFLEMYDAFKLGKILYMYNPAPDNLLKDEIEGMNPIVINRDLEQIVDAD